jgi:GNAT superfamily N-acetyltransferase
MTDEFVYASPLDPRAKPLIEDLTYEYDSRYGDFFDREGAIVEMNRYPPEAFAPPRGNFILMIRGGDTIAGGAFMRYDERTAEFKRIWTRRDLRRQGIARRLLVELEAQALTQGYSRVYLTTGFRQPEAKGLYLTNGYTALFDLNADLEQLRHLAFEKRLVAALSSDQPAEAAE